MLLGLPRISPEWELSAIAALMRPKPSTRDAVRHRQSRQICPASTRASIEKIVIEFEQHTGLGLKIHYPDGGEYFLVADLEKEQEESGRALALIISRALPVHWLVVGRLFVRNGLFYRRKHGYQLKLVVATDVHLSRDTRKKLRGFL